MHMPNPFPIELRERAVSAYESGDASHTSVAAQFGVNPWTLLRWVIRRRETGSVAPWAKGGGQTSPVDMALLEEIVRATRDATTEELTREYNGRVTRGRRVHRSSIPSCATIRPRALRGCAVVEPEHAAEAFTAPDCAAAGLGGRGRDAFVA